MPMPPPPQQAVAPPQAVPPPQGAPPPPAGGGGMLAQAAQAASQVPPPGPPEQVGGGQNIPGMPQASPNQTISQDAAAHGIPGQAVDVMPETGQAYQGENVDIHKEPASAAEEKEYQRVSGALQKIMYRQDSIADAVMKQLDPNDKISSTTKASTLLIQQLDEKLDMDEVVIPQITQDAVGVVAELAENRFGTQYSEQDMTAVLGATWEGVMAMFGIDEGEYNQLIDEYGPQLDSIQKSYDGFLAQGQPAPQPGGKPPEQAVAPPGAINPAAPPVPMA